MRRFLISKNYDSESKSMFFSYEIYKINVSIDSSVSSVIRSKLNLIRIKDIYFNLIDS